ncbi:MAG TPA: diphthine--ammonia ligase [Gemmatimonadales bacterium]
MTTHREPVLFSWSGGKDSALALHRVLSSGRYEVVALLTTINEHYQRVSMHGVRVELLEAQAHAIGLPLEKMFVSERSSNEEYAERMQAILLRYQALGVGLVVFGDIFLADLRQWREANLARIGMKALFPLWNEDTTRLIAEFHANGFRSIVCCANDAYLGESHVGAELDPAFVAALPSSVDPCGENGEYHSFAFAGPIFRAPVAVVIGEKVYRPVELTHPGATVAPADSSPDRPATKGFWFCDLTEG